MPRTLQVLVDETHPWHSEDAVASGAHAVFFPHGIGHLLGLDVHDMENFGDPCSIRARKKAV